MNIKSLRKLLEMFPDDTLVYIQTTPDDYASPIEQKNIALWPASPDKIQETVIGINREKLVLTAFHPEK